MNAQKKLQLQIKKKKKDGSKRATLLLRINEICMNDV